MKHLVVFLLVVLISQHGNAQDKNLYTRHWLVKGQDTLPYRMLLPENFNPKTKYPLIIFLHGSGERGNDNEKQLVHGASLFLIDSIRRNYPAIVVFPQCAETDFWSNVSFQYDSAKQRTGFVFNGSKPPTTAMKMLMALIKELQHNFRIRKDQWYAGGLSMGGMGTFELVARMPGKFAAAFPICGGGDTVTAPKLVKTKWWIFHGLKDDVVHPSLSQSMADAIKQSGGDAKLTLYPNANHNSWDPAFAEKDLMQWLFAQYKRK